MRPLSIHFDDRRRKWVITGRTSAGFRTLEIPTGRDTIGADPAVVLERALFVAREAGWPSVRWEIATIGAEAPHWKPA